jgi:pilus assembly protein Flp/PilA
MKKLFSKLTDYNGTTALEYAIIAALISLAIVSAVGLIGNHTSNAFGRVNNGFVSAR